MYEHEEGLVHPIGEFIPPPTPLHCPKESEKQKRQNKNTGIVIFIKANITIVLPVSHFQQTRLFLK